MFFLIEKKPFVVLMEKERSYEEKKSLNEKKKHKNKFITQWAGKLSSMLMLI